jgi:hypothetical protein
MMLKVGDRVEVLSGNDEQACLVGKIGTVESTSNTDGICIVCIDLDDDHFFYPEELKKV